MQPSFSCLIALAATCLIGTPDESLGDMHAEHAGLDAAIQVWDAALTSHDANAMASLTTDDFILIPPNAPPVRGRNDAKAFWRQTTQPDVQQMSLIIEEMVMQGDIAYRTGRYDNRLPNGVVIRRGMFVDIWKRADNEWLIHRHMYSINEPAASSGEILAPAKDQPILERPQPH